MGKSKDVGTVHKAIEEMLQWFAGQQIRNVAVMITSIKTKLNKLFQKLMHNVFA